MVVADSNTRDWSQVGLIETSVDTAELFSQV
jgi:hypothetical protein